MTSPITPEPSPAIDLSDHEWDVVLAIGTGEPSLPVDLAAVARLEQLGIIEHSDAKTFVLTPKGWERHESRWGGS